MMSEGAGSPDDREALSLVQSLCRGVVVFDAQAHCTPAQFARVLDTAEQCPIHPLPPSCGAGPKKGVDFDNDESDVISTAPTSEVSLSVSVRDHVVAGGPPHAVPRERLDENVGVKLALSQEGEQRSAGPLDNTAVRSGCRSRLPL